MKIVAVMPVRNESWILGLSARAALMWCDALVILLHDGPESNDEDFRISRVIAWEERVLTETADYDGRVIVRGVSGIWDEMRHRQSLLAWARMANATHIALIDADEILCGSCLPTIRQQIGNLPPQGMLRAQLFNMRGTPNKYHANGLWGNRDVALAFRDDPRAHWAGDRFHHREPAGVNWLPSKGSGVMHLWAVDERRARAKQALYKLTERMRWPNKPVASIDQYYSQAIYPEAAWSDSFRVKEWTYQEAPAEWWEPYAHLMQYLHVDREPWQEAECRRIVAEHPGIEKGLDLFGVVNAKS